MTSITALAPAHARIAEIQSRFTPFVRAASSPSAARSDAIDTATFSSVMSKLVSAATGDAATDDLSVSGRSGSIDLTSLTSLLASRRSEEATPSVARTGATGADAVTAAKQYLGVDYVWGGTDPSKGLDCSGLVQRAYRDIGVELPRVSYDQAKAGTAVPSIDQAKPGDLVAFGSPVDHIAIYVGDGKIIQAPRTGDVVRITEIRRPIAAIRRVIPDTGVGTADALTDTAATGPTTGSTGIAGAEPYDALFRAAGARHGLNPRLLAAVAKTESNFDPSARSGVGAIGLMQFMPATAAGMGIDPTDPAQAIDGAARYLRTQLDRFGSVDLALAAYNAGPGAVQRAGGIPPYAETRNYVTKVTALLGGQSPTATSPTPVGSTNGVLS